MLRLAGVAVGLAALSVSVGVPTLQARAQEHSIAYKMAAIDCDCVPRAVWVVPYQRVLTKLVTQKCKETRLELANELTTAQQKLVRDGHGHYTYLRLMHLLDRSIPNSVQSMRRCRDAIGAMITRIEKG